MRFQNYRPDWALLPHAIKKNSSRGLKNLKIWKKGEFLMPKPEKNTGTLYFWAENLKKKKKLEKYKHFFQQIFFNKTFLSHFYKWIVFPGNHFLGHILRNARKKISRLAKVSEKFIEVDIMMTRPGKIWAFRNSRLDNLKKSGKTPPKN